MLNKCLYFVNLFFFKIFLMWTIFKVFIEFVTILLLFHVLVFWPWGIWDLSSPTWDQTHTPCIGRRSLNHWTTREIPHCYYWLIFIQNLLCVNAKNCLCVVLFSPVCILWIRDYDYFNFIEMFSVKIITTTIRQGISLWIRKIWRSTSLLKTLTCHFLLI